MKGNKRFREAERRAAYTARKRRNSRRLSGLDPLDNPVLIYEYPVNKRNLDLGKLGKGLEWGLSHE